jgi:AcrR family transcriptional regulator
MVRPREFDREQALDLAMRTFWAKGFAATSTDDLLQAMRIGRQSLYNAFGDKRQLYLEALKTYQQRTIAGHVTRLMSAATPLDGIRDLLFGLAPAEDRLRALGCMGVGSVGEFGATDPELVDMREKARPLLAARLIERIREGQASGEIDPGMDPEQAAGFIQMTMTGLQLAARSGASIEQLQTQARFAVDRLRRR